MNCNSNHRKLVVETSSISSRSAGSKCRTSPQKKVYAFSLDTFIVHLSREQTIVSSVWRHELAGNLTTRSSRLSLSCA